MRNRCYLAPDAIVSQAIPAGLHPLDRTHASRRPGVAHGAQSALHLVGPLAPTLGA